MRICRGVVVLLAVLLAACGGRAEAGGRLTVFAAASLTDAFEQVGEAFMQANPGVTVTFNFASSATLATQIMQGAPADVFASANQAQMDVVEEAGLLAGERRDFAGNLLQIAVEPGNPLDITGLADLARPDVSVVLAAEEVPAGQYAREALAAQGIQVRPASLEPDVRAALARVALGEADAAVVYASDVATASGEVQGVDIPADQNIRATYPIATLADAPDPDAARAFVDFVLSDEGQALLAANGFTAP